MNFTLRKTSDYAVCSLEHESAKIEFMIDNEEAKYFLEEMQNAVEMLEWFIATTEK